MHAPSHSDQTRPAEQVKLDRRRFAGGLAAGIATSRPGCATALDRRLRLTGLIKLPVEDWAEFEPRLYTQAHQNRADLSWRTNWAAAGDRFSEPSLNQVQEYGEAYGPSARGGAVVDGPTSPLVGYMPFSIVDRPGGSRALRITPRFVPPKQRARTFGYPVLSGVLSSAGKTLPGKARSREFYAANYSVTIFRQVRLPRGMWAALWQYPRDNYGTSSATEIDAIETLHGLGPGRVWLSVHSDDTAWRARIAEDRGRYEPRLTQWAGDRNVSKQIDLLSNFGDAKLYDIAVAVGPEIIQHWINDRLILELPTPRDIGEKLRHDIIDLGYPNEIGPPTSSAALDYLEVGPIERYVFPGVSRVVWRQNDAGDGSGIPGATRVGGPA